MPVTRIFPVRPDGPSSYGGSQNVIITEDGASPSFDHGSMTSAGDKGHYFGDPVETKNPSGNPRQYVFANDKVWRFEGGTLTQDNDFDDVVQGLTMLDDAVTPPNERLVAWFGNSTAHDASGGHFWRNLGTDTTPWTEHSGATVIKAWFGKRLGHRCALVTGGSGQGLTFLGDHNLSVVVSGLYDGTTTNIGPAEPVGMSDWPLIEGAP